MTYAFVITHRQQAVATAATCAFICESYNELFFLHAQSEGRANRCKKAKSWISTRRATEPFIV
jgi:hypothetical protein